MKNYTRIKTDITKGRKIHYKEAVELPAVKFRLILQHMKKANYRWDPLSMTWSRKSVEVR